MNLSYIRYNLVCLIGRVATAHPEAWIYSWVLVGMTAGIATMSGLGWFLGSAFHHPMTGMWLGMGWYAYGFTMTVEPMKAMAESQIQKLHEFRSLM